MIPKTYYIKDRLKSLAIKSDIFKTIYRIPLIKKLRLTIVIVIISFDFQSYKDHKKIPSNKFLTESLAMDV